MKYKYVKSEKLTIKCGVSQGSVYISRCPKMTTRCSKMLSIILFADDTDLFFSHKSVDTLQQTRNQEMKKVASWLSANKLNSLNVKKNYLIFELKGKKTNQSITFKINEQLIDQVKNTKV